MKKLIKLASQYDISLDINMDTPLDITAWAPQGKKFKTGTHCVVIANGDDTPEFTNTWRTAIEALQYDIGTGLVDCDDGPECEHCYPTEEID